MSKKILVVDDDPDIRQILLDRMSSYGYAVETAEGGREAIDALRLQQFDGILLDLRMPEVDGVEVLKWTHESQITLPVVMVSALSMQELTTKAAAHSCAYLPKPFDPHELKQIAEDCFGSAA